MKILILGCNGQLGLCLKDQLQNSEHTVVYASRDQIDVSDFEATANKILEIKPNILINATAYTAVDKAEEEPQTANIINCLAISKVANICSKLGCWLIHVSTDYVFDGKSSSPYRENDYTAPQSVYGETKLGGERAIQSSGCNYLIIRTAWLFSEYGNNFLKSMLRLGSERHELNIVGDQIGCPTYAQDIAKSIVTILPFLDLKGSSSGIYHYCGDKPCSWYEFARAIFLEAELQGLKTPSYVKSITTADYPTPAIRPAYSVLDCSAIESCFSITRSNWRDGIKIVIDRLQD
jgi:dTDP-4-dehydrorhamnose reductase